MVSTNSCPFRLLVVDFTKLDAFMHEGKLGLSSTSISEFDFNVCLLTLGDCTVFHYNVFIHKNFLCYYVLVGFINYNLFEGTLSGLRQFLATEIPLKMMKKAFYFTSKALFVLKIFKFLSWLFGHVAKRLD